MAPKITLTGACERDIDLLLMEEFASSPSFGAWFLARVGLKDRSNLLEVARSVTTSNGESDLELTLESLDGIQKVLIENKVDAQFQPKQAERYRERAEVYMSTGACKSALTVLVAPEAYVTNSEDFRGFDRHVSLEAIEGWFRESPDVNIRREHKCTLLARTIERSGSGWTLIPDAPCTAFWLAYWELADRLAPELEMPRPKVKPADSTFVYFRPPGLGKQVAIVHKLTYGNVDLQFAGMGANTAALKTQYSNALEPGMIIDRATKSGVVRIRVPPLNVALPLSESLPAAEQGIRAALQLLRWHRRQEA